MDKDELILVVSASLGHKAVSRDPEKQGWEHFIDDTRI